MNEPAKDEAELIAQITDTLSSNTLGFTHRGQAACVLAAIRAAGWAVVPVEPSDEMLWAADRAPVPECEMDNPDHLQFVLFCVRRAEWAAMLAAAPGVKP